MNIIHIENSLQSRQSWEKLQNITKKLKKEGKKFLSGECHKYNRFYIIIW